MIWQKQALSITVSVEKKLHIRKVAYISHYNDIEHIHEYVLSSKATYREYVRFISVVSKSDTLICNLHSFDLAQLSSKNPERVIIYSAINMCNKEDSHGR